MRQELEEKLVKAAPVLLKDYHGDQMKTCMAWGMECDDGWFDLLMELCSKLEEINNSGNGRVVATQIKEKFGELCFYYYTENMTKEEHNKVYEIVSEAEQRSWDICEICGKPATHTTKGWIKRLCNECYGKLDRK